MAVLIATAAPAGAALAFSPDFTSWVVPDQDWYYPGNRLYVTAHIMDQAYTSSPGELWVRFDPAFKGVVVVDRNLSACTRSYTPAGGILSGTWFKCSFAAIGTQNVRFYAIAPDRPGRYNISTFARVKGSNEQDRDESDDSSGIQLLIANP
ncbi:MAG: hypothetical protein U0893_02805 [Chloroflexota bacterium]